MKCHKCNCESTEDNWVGGFSPDKATCERCHYSSYDIPNTSSDIDLTIKNLKPGQFFEFNEPGYCFGRCLFIGIDNFEYVNFVHQSAGLSRFIINDDDLHKRNPKVTIEVPQEWKRNES